MRKFAFVIFDIDNSIIERFSLNMIAITDPSGLGWKLKLSTIEGDVTDILTKVVQEKQAISMILNFVHQGYEKFSVLSQWLQKYLSPMTRLALEYDDGVQVRYVEGKVSELKKTEKDEYDNLACAATFTPLTPFFLNIEQTIRIQVSSIGKSYTFRYPYTYGKNRIENNEINNPYIAAVPVTDKITGAIYEPTVQLFDSAGNSYNRVQFSGVTLLEGQYIIINSAEKKIYFFDGEKLQDFTAETDPRYDTFLFAQNGISRIDINFDNPTDTGELTGSWRQYIL